MRKAIAICLATTFATAAPAGAGIDGTVPATAPTPACHHGDTIALDPAVGAPLHLGTQSYRQTLALCDHEIVLTFDDGPSQATTPRVLRALADAGLHATFFLIGRNTREHPELARAEMGQGHTVGHHSDTHPSFTLRGFDEHSAETDISNGIAADEKAVYGEDADPAHPHVPFFRFPGFADTPELLAYLDRRGIAVFGSDLWAGDWIAMTPDHERQRVMTDLERRPHHNGIILFHDTRPSTAAMLPDLFRDLKINGYHVVQLVYKAGAPAPMLSEGAAGMPLTERIIAHLATPIRPGSHHLRGPTEMPSGANVELQSARH